MDVSNDIVRINVIVSGKGISKEGQNELFTSFGRLGQENSNIEGTGIGLVITKKLVELMGGKIGADSELNKGSTFWFEFPLASVSVKKNINNITDKNKILKKSVIDENYELKYYSSIYLSTITNKLEMEIFQYMDRFRKQEKIKDLKKNEITSEEF